MKIADIGFVLPDRTKRNKLAGTANVDWHASCVVFWYLKQKIYNEPV